MNALRKLILCLAILAFAATPVPAAPGDGPPYEKEMLRLAEIFGSVHYLRELCDADEGQTWRSLMQQGYHGFQQSYRRCTETAVYVIKTYMAEGAELAQKIASRYGR